MEDNNQSTAPKDLLGLYKPYNDLVAANERIAELENAENWIVDLEKALNTLESTNAIVGKMRRAQARIAELENTLSEKAEIDRQIREVIWLGEPGSILQAVKMLWDNLQKAQERVKELETERDDLRESRDHYQAERDGLQKRNDIQAGQLRHIDSEISPLMSEVARLKQEAVALMPERASDEELAKGAYESHPDTAIAGNSMYWYSLFSDSKERHVARAAAVRASVEAPLLAEIQRLEIECQDRAFYAREFAAVSQERDAIKARVAELEVAIRDEEVVYSEFRSACYDALGIEVGEEGEHSGPDSNLASQRIKALRAELEAVKAERDLANGCIRRVLAIDAEAVTRKEGAA